MHDERSPALGRLGVRIASGPRAAEAQLLGELAAALDECVHEWSRLATPLRIVVPSTSLREHLSARLVGRFGSALAGVKVQTHRALAAEVLERAGEPLPRGQELFPLLVARAAEDEPELHERLGALREGFGVVTAAVEDFFDAGFEAEDAGPLQARLRAHAAGPWAGAVVRVARHTRIFMDRLGLVHPSSLLQRASERIGAGSADGLPTRALWLFGFADVTGVTLEWIRGLVSRLGARLIVSQPLDPADESRRETRFSEPLLAQLGVNAAGPTRVPDQETHPPELALVSAAGAAGEARAVAERIRLLLDRGACAERILIVARSFVPYAGVLREQLARLGIPFTEPGRREVADSAGRHILAATELLERREHTLVERWLDASAHPEAADPDLRLGLRVMGALRLEDLVQLDLAAVLSKGELLLPVRDGCAPRPAEGASGVAEFRPRRRRLAGARLESVRAQADAVLTRLHGWPRRAALQRHLAHLDALLRGELGWGAEGGFDRAFEALAALAEGVPARLGLERAEFGWLAGRVLGGAAPASDGRSGGGVQVLSVMAACGRTADHLFVMGLNRGVFPRPIAEDPLISDRERRLCREVLPTFPLKSRGRDEERHLFAELLASSPRVTLSWQAENDDGRECPVSPLVVRLLQGKPELCSAASEANPGVQVGAWPPPGPLRPPHEHLIGGALEGTRDTFAALLPIALREVLSAVEDTPEPARQAPLLAASRLAVLEALDPVTSRGSSTLGPYFGFVSRVGSCASPGPEPALTELERTAACPWWAFLTKRLRLEEAPHSGPEFPRVDARLSGILVHRVLERIAGGGGVAPPAELATALDGPSAPPVWPEPSALEALVAQEAERLSREEGVPFSRLVRALVARARDPLERARQCDAAEPDVVVLGAEVRGELELLDGADQPRRIRFRVDRVDRVEGRLRLTDYKTGRPLSVAVRRETRERHFLEAVRQGTTLQASAYLEAARKLCPDPSPMARYLFLHPQAPPQAQEFVVPDEGEEDSWRAAFLATCRSVLGAWDAGSFFPRLLEPGDEREPRRCQSCSVRLACLRGESAQRMRLRRWITQARERPAGTLLLAERALLGLWDLSHPLPSDERPS